MGKLSLRVNVNSIGQHRVRLADLLQSKNFEPIKFVQLLHVV